MKILDSYLSSIGTYDEIIDKNGYVKPHWKTLFDTLEKLGLNELELRNQEIIDKLKENGVTYNVYESNVGMNRPWKLDIIPFLIHESEWNEIEKGLIQRATLLDLILKDLTGPQRLIKEKILPAELFFNNSGFLVPCFDIKQKLENQLIFYACDLARGADGKMWLLDNRTQSPSGSGYALENRTILGKTIPELNQNIHRNRLSPYFNDFQQTVSNLGNNKGESKVVFLTPGLGSETYFEHVYLSSYLGYTLVQGSDLLVRDGFVYLKSFNKLELVDVIIKRVDDEWIDPLELRQDSLLGVPGLLNVIRQGNVAVINPPGTSLLENHGLMAFMQNACKFLLNESLLINSVATWWCGQPKELEYVLNNLNSLIIKKTNRKNGFKSVYGKLLSQPELEQLKIEILKSPKEYVAKEEVNLSTTPSFIDGKIVPRLASMRAYVVSDGSNYKVMQGGLTRSSPFKDRFLISNQLGGISKDTWIVSEFPNEVSDIQNTRKFIPNYTSNSLTSRNAENLFWVGRLAERTLSLVSFLRIIIDRTNENVRHKGKTQPEFLLILLKSLTHLTLTYPGFTDPKIKKLKTNPTPELLQLVTNVNKLGSLVYNIKSLLHTSNQVTEKWNYGTRRIITMIEDSYARLNDAETVNFNQINGDLDRLTTRLFALYGNIEETLPRDNGFYLFEIGKKIERILSLISILRSCFSFKNSAETENIIMEAVLENHHLLQQYRYIYKSNLSLTSVLNMIFLDENLPYTLAYLLDDLYVSIDKLPKNNDATRLSIVQKTVLKAISIIKLIDSDDLAKEDKKNMYRVTLDTALAQVFELISNVTINLTSLYFNHSTIQHSFLDSIENSKSDEV